MLSSLYLHNIVWLAPLLLIHSAFLCKKKTLVCTVYHFCQIIFQNPQEQHYLLFSLTEKPLNWMLIFCRPSKNQNGLKKSKLAYLHQPKEFQRKSCSVKLIIKLWLSLARPSPKFCILQYFTFSSWPVRILFILPDLV